MGFMISIGPISFHISSSSSGRHGNCAIDKTPQVMEIKDCLHTELPEGKIATIIIKEWYVVHAWVSL